MFFFILTFLFSYFIILPHEKFIRKNLCFQKLKGSITRIFLADYDSSYRSSAVILYHALSLLFETCIKKIILLLEIQKSKKAVAT